MSVSREADRKRSTPRTEERSREGSRKTVKKGVARKAQLVGPGKEASSPENSPRSKGPAPAVGKKQEEKAGTGFPGEHCKEDGRAGLT